MLLAASAETRPQFLWAHRAGGGGNDEADAVAADSAGNVFVTGFFTGACSIGNSNFVSSGLEDIFLAKYDASGNFLWARQAGGTGDDFGLGVATDPSGNAYVTGSFQNTASFGAASLTSTRSNDVFVAKYSPTGTLVWASKAGGNGNEAANAIAVDAQGNAYITGTFDASATFGAITLTNTSGLDDIFVARCSSAGNFVWARQAGGGTNDAGNGIALDGATNVYVTGFFGGAAVFGATNLTSAGANGLPDIFLAKYDSAGNLLWVRQGGGTGDDRGNAVAADFSGNVSLTGQFFGAASFGSSNLVANGSGADIFVARYNTAGNLLWLRRAGGNNAIYGDAGFGIVTDLSSNSFVTGYFSGTATFGSSNLVSAGFENIFCAKYDSAGSLAWLRGAGGSLNDFAYAAAWDGQSNVFLAGFFTSSTVAFDATTLTNSGGRDLFLTKLGVPFVPGLSASISNGQFRLAWPVAASNFLLESATNLPATNWLTVAGGTNIVGSVCVATVPLSGPRKFFRLRKP